MVDNYLDACIIISMMIKKETEMNQYAIYQLSDENPKIRDLYFMDAKEIEAISDEFDFVAVIKAENLEQVFRIGNFVYPEDDEFRAVIGKMRSISVGDIVECIETGETHVVANYGFKKITMKESV